MARRSAAVLAVGISLLMLWGGLPLASAHSPAAPGARPSPQAFLSITPYNAYGQTNDFNPGLGGGAIWFRAVDTGGATSGTVTIVDQNYTRDGIPAVAASWSITFNGSVNDSRGTSMYYTIPHLLNWSGNWTINLTTPNGSVETTFRVQVYWFYAAAEQSGLLPGHSGAIDFEVYRANDAAFANIQTLQAVGYYLDDNGSTLPIPGLSHNISPAAAGAIPVTMPANATQASGGMFTVELWANQTTAGKGMNWTRATAASIGVATVDGLSLTFVDCAGSCYTFASGIPEQLVIDVSASWTNSYHQTFPVGAGGLTASLTFFSGKTVVTAPSGTPTTLTTNGTGTVRAEFIPTTSTFSNTTNSSVRVMLTDPLEPGFSLNNSIGFQVVSVTQGVRVLVTLAQLVYYSGDTVVANWSLGNTQSGGAPGWAANWWSAYSLGNPELTLGFGTISSTAPMGSVSFTLPADFQGSFYVYVGANNATTYAEGYIYGVADQPALLLSPSETAYNPGDTVTISIERDGQALGAASLYYSVTDGQNVVLGGGAVSGHSFSFMVPTSATPSYIYYYVAAQTSAGGVLSTASGYIAQRAGYHLAASISTRSQYSDGTYQPGQTISLSYSLSPIGSTPGAGAIMLIVAPDATVADVLYGDLANLPGAVEIQTANWSGTVSVTIPSNAADGSLSFFIEATPVQASHCNYLYPTCTGYQSITVNVQAHPSALDSLLGGPDSGFTLGMLLILVLILVLAIVGVLWIRRRGRASLGPKSSPPREFSPPPSGPSGGAPSSDSSGGQPPMPGS